MFCPNCAQPVKDGSKFCEYCGFPLAGIQVPTQTTVAAEPVAPVEESPVVDVQEEVPVQSTVVRPTHPAVTYQQPVQTQATTAYPQPVQQQTYAYQQPVQQPAYQQPVQQQATYQQPAQAQPTAAYPQPVQQQTYAYQQPTYQQVPNQQVGTPQAPAYAQSYAQLDIPQTSTNEPITKKLWFKILIGIIAALVLFAIGKTVSDAISRAQVNNGSATTQSDDPIVIDDGDDVFDIIDNIVNSTNSTDILDSNNNPTVYALLNLDGATITEALREVGWSFDEDYLLWSSEDMNNAFYVYGEDGYEFTKSDIEGMAANGGRDAAIMCVLLDDYDYDSIDDVAENIVRANIQDTYEDDDALYMILVTESGDEDFACLYHDDYSGLYRLEIANEEAIESGCASDFFGFYGYTIEDIWYEIAGRGIAVG